jgi:hypothetical protein
MIVVIAPAAAAKEKHKHSHKAHSHGDAKLDVAVDGKIVVVKFEAPGDVIFGFEHKAKTDAHKNKIATEMKRLNEQYAELLKFPADAMCILSEKTVEAAQAEEAAAEVKDGKDVHADVDVTWKFMCHSELTGKVLKLGFFAAWPRLKTLKTQVLGSAGQKGLTLKNDKTDLTL